MFLPGCITKGGSSLLAGYFVVVDFKAGVPNLKHNEALASSELFCLLFNLVAFVCSCAGFGEPPNK